MLGDKIKLYREAKKMTQNDLAKLLEITRPTFGFKSLLEMSKQYC